MKEAQRRAGTVDEGPAQEALRLIALADRHGVALRLIGGVAVQLSCPSARDPALARTPRDIDLVVLPGSFAAAIRLLESDEYTADLAPAFPDVRLLFSQSGGRPVELYAGRIPFGIGLELQPAFVHAGPAVPPWMLLAAKVLRPSLRLPDLIDLAAIVADQPVLSTGIDSVELAVLVRQHLGLQELLVSGLQDLSLFAQKELPPHLCTRIVGNVTAILAVLSGGTPHDGR